MKNRTRLWFLALGAGSAFIVDRVSKMLALHFLVSPMVINSLLTLELTFNRGISGGLLHFDNTAGFLLVGFLVSSILAIITVWTWYTYRNGGSIIGQVLIITGGVSNIIDRLFYNGVVDFISVSLPGWHWSIFNIADVVINIGVIVLIAQSFFLKSSHQ